MTDILTDQEFLDAMALVETIPHYKVAEELERLAVREKEILGLEMDAEMREITIYNLTILSAAAARMKIMSAALDPKEGEADEV
jgi:hypothetical protein